MNNEHILTVSHLKTYFKSNDGRIIKAVDGVSFFIKKGEVFSIVGESGCGKTVTIHSILGLINQKKAFVDGEVLFNGENLLKKDVKSLSKMRGSKISMIFQDPMTSLNPVLTIGDQLVETFLVHTKTGYSEAFEKCVNLLEMVKIPNARERMNSFPFEMSGGQRQRVMIAMALALEPELLIADEPTTALDVTVQREIMELLISLKKEYGLSILFISHDLGVVSHISNRMAVMYAGRIVEAGDTSEILNNPMHPYTIGLLNSLPSFAKKGERLVNIKGALPDPSNLPIGCYFEPRCSDAMEICKNGYPGKGVVGEREIFCFLCNKKCGVPV